MRPVSREPFPGNPDNNEEIKKKDDATARKQWIELRKKIPRQSSGCVLLLLLSREKLLGALFKFSGTFFRAYPGEVCVCVRVAAAHQTTTRHGR